MTPEIGPLSFGTFEKQAPRLIFGIPACTKYLLTEGQCNAKQTLPYMTVVNATFFAVSVIKDQMQWQATNYDHDEVVVCL